MIKTLSNSLLNMFAKNFHLPSSSAGRVFLHARTRSRIRLPRRLSSFSLAVRNFSGLLSAWYRLLLCCRAAVLSRCAVVQRAAAAVLSCCGTESAVRCFRQTATVLPSVPWLYKVLSLGSLKSVCSESKGAVEWSVHAPTVFFPLWLIILCTLVTSSQNLKTFQDLSSHRIFRRIHRVLNINKNKN